jgi:hypothetical protein
MVTALSITVRCQRSRWMNDDSSGMIVDPSITEAESRNGMKEYYNHLHSFLDSGRTSLLQRRREMGGEILS